MTKLTFTHLKELKKENLYRLSYEDMLEVCKEVADSKCTWCFGEGTVEEPHESGGAFWLEPCGCVVLNMQRINRYVDT